MKTKKELNLVILVFLIILLITLTGCSNKENTVKDEILAENNVNTVEKIIENQENIEEKLMKVLNNEEKFIGESGKKVYLKDYDEFGVEDNGLREIEKYMYVNMDQKGENELLALTKSEGGFYILLHYEDGEVYGYFITIRGIWDVKSDGTHFGDGGIYTYGYYLMKFDKTKCESITLAFRSDDEYTIDDKVVSKSEFDEFETNQKQKENVKWERFINASLRESLAKLDFNENGEMVYSTKDDIVNEYSEDPVNYLTLRNDGTVEEYIDFPGVTMKGTYIFEDNKFIVTYTEQIESYNDDGPISINTKYVYELRDDLLYCELNQYQTDVYKREK